MKHFPETPGGNFDANLLGIALYLEREYWKNMEIAVANGISKALEG